MKRIFLVLFLAPLFFCATKTSWAMGTKPAPQAKDTVAVNKQTKADPVVANASAAKADSAKATSSANRPINEAKAKKVKIPKLVDLGAGKCIPCKMMAPILDQLEKDFKGKMDVVVIDVWQNADEGSKYKIRVIPTQIFYSPEGKELFRHEGFYSREDILAKWKELGHEFKK